MRSIATVLASITLLVSACTNENNTVFQVAKNDSSLSTFVNAVLFASNNNDLAILLDNPNATLTVFAPTNDAFDALAVDVTGNPNAVGADLLTAANKDFLRSVLQYHMLGSVVTSPDIPFGLPLVTLQGNVFKIDNGTPPVITDGRNRTARFVAGDFQTGNGVLHKIDRVLLPPNMTITATIQSAASAGQFTIFAQAIAAAQLVGLLDGSAPLTVFAPTDEAFISFFAQANTTLPQLFENPQQLLDIMNYHLVSGDLFAAALPIATPITTLQSGAIVIDQNLVITDARGRTAHIVRTDILTSNGVIHVIDQVLLPQAR
jgi:transforming growth factor-beta-induced protein